MLRQKVWKYSPDIVLLAFCTGNDIADNVLSLKKKEFDPYFIPENGKLILKGRPTQQRWQEKVANNYFSRPLFQWLIQFRVMQVVQHGKGVFRDWWSSQGFMAQSSASGKNREAGFQNNIYRAPTDEVWREAWKVTEAVLVQMRNEVIRKGARFFIVVLTNGIQVTPNVSMRTAFAKTLGMKDLFYPDRRLEKFCQRKGIPVLSLAPNFQDYATQHQLFLHGFGKNLGTGHWNQNGHRQAGQALASWLCPQLSRH